MVDVVTTGRGGCSNAKTSSLLSVVGSGISCVERSVASMSERDLSQPTKSQVPDET